MLFNSTLPCCLTQSHRVVSLPLFDWRTLAVIQAFACLAISVFVNLALLQNPELYGLHPDYSCDPTVSLQNFGHAAPANDAQAVELNASALRSAAAGGPACSSATQPAVDAAQCSGAACKDDAAAWKDDAHVPDSKASAHQRLEGLTVRQSLRRPIFWMIVLSIFFIDVLWGGFNLHFVSVLEDQGLGRTSGASTFLATSIAAALSSLLCGPFFDRLPVGMKVRNQPVARFYYLCSVLVNCECWCSIGA